jgi:hypothetical protein
MSALGFRPPQHHVRAASNFENRVRFFSLSKQDRQELSEALLVQGEMREHERYVGEGNVFPMSYNANADASMNERGGDNSNPRTSPWRNENQFAWGDDQSSMGV